MSEAVKFERRGNIAIVTMNEEASMNCLTTTLVDGLIDVFAKLRTDKEVKAVVLTGSGKAYSAGGNVKRFVEGFDCDSAFTEMDNGQRLINTVLDVQMPIVAAVNGAAVGAGLSMTLMCDVAVASEKARFCSSFINVGLAPDCGCAYFLPRAVGMGRAKDLIYSGRMIGAQEALEYGIVQYVVSPEELLDKAIELAELYASKAPLAMKYAKHMLDMSLDNDMDALLSTELFAQSMLFLTEDSQEAVHAFLEKRPANLKGK